MPRKDLTLSEKIDLLEKIKIQPANTSHRSLEKITGVPKSTISRVLRNEEKLRGEWASRGNGKGTSRKRRRGGKEPEVEEALNRWFALASRFVPVTGPILKAKAEDLAKELGHEDFKATNGWLSRWKSRHEIRFGKGKGGGPGADFSEKWKTSKLAELLQRFGADDVYGARETSLLYRATPDGSLCYRLEALSGCKKALDRVTVLCCCNTSGSDRRKLLVVGRICRPRCFEGLRMDALPVVYRASKNARMTPDIFSEWLSDWDVELRRERRKILLLVDDRTSRESIRLENIRLEFLPRDTVLLPTEIVRHLKTSYREKLANFTLEAIEENLLQESSTAEEVSEKIDLLQAVLMLSDSWREMSRSTIERCGWRGTGIERNQEETSLGNDEKIITFEEKEEDEGGGGGAEEDEEETRKVTHGDAKKLVAALRLYFMQAGNEDSPMAALDACADFVQGQYAKTQNWQKNRMNCQ